MWYRFAVVRLRKATARGLCSAATAPRAYGSYGARRAASEEVSVPTEDCLFCKIVSGDVPAKIVRETERTLAFRDINPQAPTHVLVVPKDHYENAAALADADESVLAELLREAHQVAVGEGVAASGYRVVFNTGAQAGQTVFHVHAHVLGGRGLNWPPG